MIDQFLKQWGAAAPATESSIFFVRGDAGYVEWKYFNRQATPGVWADGFLHIATPQLPDVNDALSGWGFAIGDDAPTRQVLLRNGYGDVVWVQSKGDLAVTKVLSPRRGVVYSPDLRPDISSVLNFFLEGPTDRIPGRPAEHPFLDRQLYDQWVAANGSMGMNEALVCKVPYNLGGAHELENFYVEDLASFYRGTGEIYAKAFAAEG
jgi:hypothetical protein